MGCTGTKKMMVGHQLSTTFSSEDEGRSLQKDTGGSGDEVAHATQTGTPHFFLCLILWPAGGKVARTALQQENPLCSLSAGRLAEWTREVFFPNSPEPNYSVLLFQGQGSISGFFWVSRS